MAYSNEQATPAPRPTPELLSVTLEMEEKSDYLNNLCDRFEQALDRIHGGRPRDTASVRSGLVAVGQPGAPNVMSRLRELQGHIAGSCERFSELLQRLDTIG